MDDHSFEDDFMSAFDDFNIDELFNDFGSETVEEQTQESAPIPQPEPEWQPAPQAQPVQQNEQHVQQTQIQQPQQQQQHIAESEEDKRKYKENAFAIYVFMAIVVGALLFILPKALDKSEHDPTGILDKSRTDRVEELYGK